MLSLVVSCLLASRVVGQDLFLLASTAPVQLRGSKNSQRFTSTYDVLPHCQDGNQRGWPVFRNASALNASKWAGYFVDVYGEVPKFGYPICTYSFWWLYASKIVEHGIAARSNLSECQTYEGDWYIENNIFNYVISDASYIFHASPYTALPGNVWVEVTHTAVKSAALEADGSWHFYTPGSGIWFNLGSTKAYPDHKQAFEELCGFPFFNDAQFNWLAFCAQRYNFDSLQFIEHSDIEWPCSEKTHPFNPFSPFRKPMAIEILGLKANGQKLSGQGACSNKSGKGVYRAGWNASNDCVCDPTSNRLNCAISPGWPPIME